MDATLLTILGFGFLMSLIALIGGLMATVVKTGVLAYYPHAIPRCNRTQKNTYLTPLNSNRFETPGHSISF